MFRRGVFSTRHIFEYKTLVTSTFSFNGNQFQLKLFADQFIKYFRCFAAYSIQPLSIFITDELVLLVPPRSIYQ